MRSFSTILFLEEPGKKPWVALFLEREAVFKEDTTQSRLLAFSFWILVVKTVSQRMVWSWEPLHCSGRLRWDPPVLSVFWYLLTEIIDGKPFEKNKVFYPCNYFLYIFILKTSKKQQSGKNHIINFCIYHSISTLNSWLPLVQLNTHPLPLIVLEKIPDTIPFICKYLQCVCKRVFFLTQHNTLLHLNKKNKNLTCHQIHSVGSYVPNHLIICTAYFLIRIQLRSKHYD